MNIARTTHPAFAKLCVVLIALVASTSFAEERAPVSIPRLLDPATRAETLRDFLLRSDSRGMGKIFACDSLKEFERANAISVHPFPLAGKPTGYIVTFGDTEDRPPVNSARRDDPFSAGAIYTGHPRTLLPSIRSSYGQTVVVRVDGTWDEALVNESILMGMSHGLFGDFNADGKCDVATKRTDRATFGNLEYDTETLEVSPLGNSENPSLKVEWNLRRHNGSPAEWWGCWFEDADGDGVFDLNLGPNHDGTAKAAVSFHWDKAAGKWTASGLLPSIACRVKIGNEGEWSMDYEKSILTGSLSRPAEPPPDADKSRYDAKISADEYSSPWKAQTLATLSHFALLEEMQFQRHNEDARVSKLVRDRRLSPWTTPPRELAIALIRAHRDSASRDDFWIGFDTSDGGKPPENGLLTFSDGPAGCFAPAGEFITNVLCDRDNSFIARSSSWFDWANTALPNRENEFAFRRVTLSTEHARNILQTVWWLTHARLMCLGDGNGGRLGGSTSDGGATVRIKNDAGFREWNDTRFARHWNSPLLGGNWGVPKGDELVVNVASWMFEEWMPTVLGDRWNPRPEDGAGKVLEDFLAGRASYEFAGVAAYAAGSNGLANLRPLVERVVAALPKPSADELRLQELESEIAAWVRDLGPDRTDFNATYQRDIARKGEPEAESVPGLTPLPESSAWTSISVQELWFFTPFDELRTEQTSIEQRRTKSESSLSSLRKIGAFAIRTIDIRENEEALEKSAREFDGYAIQRLSKVAPAKAAEVFRELLVSEKEPEASELREALIVLGTVDSTSMDSIDAVMSGQRALRKADLEEHDSETQRPTSADWRLAGRWIKAIVPPNSPMRYRWPQVNSKLFAILRSGYAHPAVYLAIARRAPRGAWDSLASNTVAGFTPLAVLSLNHPDLFRKRLRAELAAKIARADAGAADAAFAAWLADIRDLAPALKKVATSCAADREGYSPPARCHMPRCILSLWLEPDAATRAKMLLAFAMGNAFDAEELPEAQRRLAGQFKDAWAKCKAEGKTDIREFVEWCEANQRIPSGQLGFVKGLLPK